MTKRVLKIAKIVAIIAAIIIGCILTQPVKKQITLNGNRDFCFEISQSSEQVSWTGAIKKKGAITGSTLTQVSTSVPRPAFEISVAKERTRSEAKVVSAVYEYTNEAIVRDFARPFGLELDFAITRDEVHFTYKGEVGLGINISDVDFDIAPGDAVVYCLLPPVEVIYHEVLSDSYEIVEHKDSIFAEISPEIFIASMDAARGANESRALADRATIGKAQEEAEKAVLSLIEPLLFGREVKFLTKTVS